MDVIVVGAGIQGLAVAAALADEGHAVQVLERETPGSRASWVAAGLLSPSSPWKYPRALLELSFAAEALWPDHAAALLAATGIDPEYERAGIVYPVGASLSRAEVEEETRRRRAIGFRVEDYDRARLQVLVPGLPATVTGGAYQASAARVRPPRVLAALRRRCAQLGVDLESFCDVAALACDGPRVVGVRTASGQTLEADRTVLAAGAWSEGLARTCGVSIPIEPIRGQMLLFRGEPGVLGPTLHDGSLYLVPRRDGHVLVGSTMESVGFEAVTTDEALRSLRERALALFPPLGGMEEVMAWAGLRPGTPDRLPYLGEVDERPGLVLATGHFRNGILLAAITAPLVAAVVGGREPAMDLSPFAPRDLGSAAR